MIKKLLNFFRENGEIPYEDPAEIDYSMWIPRNKPKNRAERRKMQQESIRNYKRVYRIHERFLDFVVNQSEDSPSYHQEYQRHMQLWQSTLKMMELEKCFKYTVPDYNFFERIYKPITDESK